MTKLNLLVKILAVMLVATGISLFAGQAMACKSFNSKSMLLCQNSENMNMDNMNMNHNNMESDKMIEKGYAISPVSHARVKITKDTPYTLYGDRKYYFTSEQEKQEFLQDPKKFINNTIPEEGNKPPE
ncbi:MAG: hypothetical protein ACP5JP_09365, partial [bacterium]